MTDKNLYRPKRTAKLRARLFCFCLIGSIVLCIPFATMIMSWQLEFYQSIGEPHIIFPKLVTFIIRVGVIFSIAGGIGFLYYKKYNLSGGLFCLAGILSWAFFQPIYSPVYLFRWLYSYWSIPQLAGAINTTFLYSGIYIILFTAGELLLFSKRPKEASDAYGTAEISKGDELKQPKGLIIGRHINDDDFLRYNDNRHLVTIAPTRSGKGTGSIIPNILTYPNNLIVIDPKGENCDYTYKRRLEMGQDVYVLDPFQISNYSRYEGANSFNPLDTVDYQDESALEYCNDIRDSVITSNPQGLKDFWMRAAQTMYSGFIYYISQAPEFHDPDHTDFKPELRRLTTVNDLLKLKHEDLMQYTKNISESEEIPLQVKKVANDILSVSNSKKMLGSIIKTLQVNIEFMDSPYLRDTLQESDFSLEEIINENSTLYVIIPPDKLRIYRKWLQMIVELIIKKTTQIRSPKNPAIENRILFLLDEFANIGRMDYVKDSYSIIAGYGMQMWTFVQNVSQLKNTYKDDWQTFISNSGILQTFGASEVETAKYISEMLGETTTFSEVSSQQTKVGSMGIEDDTGSSKRVSEQKRPLKTPDEVMRIRDNRQIIKKQGLNPVISRKVRYFADPEFENMFISREQANKLSNEAPEKKKPQINTVAERKLQNIIDVDSSNNDSKTSIDEEKQNSETKEEGRAQGSGTIFSH